jgi:myosin heavy subunit
MTEPIRTDVDYASFQNSRELARYLAAEMVAHNQFPNAEVIRKQISRVTNGAMNPSASTIQDEIRKWHEDVFWPTYHAMGSVPQESGFPGEVKRIFTESFHNIVMQLQAAASAQFDVERADFQRQAQEAENVVRGLQEQVQGIEQRLAEVQDQYEAELQAHAGTKEQLEATGTEVRELNAKLQAAYEKQAAHEVQLNDVRKAERDRADKLLEDAAKDRRRDQLEIDMARQRAKSVELSLQGQVGENRRLVHEHAQAQSEATAARKELESLRKAHAEEVRRMTEALRAAHAGATQAERMKPTVRPAGGKALGTKPVARNRRSLHKPPRQG